jgi:alkylation response protein AidB-like acyl-CoA dehydrogenase
MTGLFKLSEEQQAFAEAIRDFAQRECGTREQRDALAKDVTEAHNSELYGRVAELGWPGVIVPEEYGGEGGSMVDMCVLVEETQRGLVPINGMATTLVVAGPYERFGTEEQKREMLGGIAKGAVEAVAMSEPEAGSDVANISCRAVRNGEGWVVNGQKTWTSNAMISDHILLIARTDSSGSKHEGLTMFNVPAGIDGMEVRPIETMGGREVNDVFFTDCRLPDEAVLGEVDRAWTQLMAGLNVERLIIAAVLLGIAQRAFDDALAYVKERRQFDRPIGSFQAIRHRLADLATEIECARLLTYSVARRVDEEPETLRPREVSMAKLKVTEVAKSMSLEGLQMMGGYGYSTEYDMERLVRISLAGTIYAGANEVQRDIIGKTLGL